MRRARFWGWAAVLLLLASVTASAGAAANPSGAATASPAANASGAVDSNANADIAALLAQGDAFDAKLDNAHSLENYLHAEKLGATDPDTLAHIARQYALL